MRKSLHSRAYKVLSQHLVAARHAAGLSQQELAKKLGRNQSFVAKYEGGERRVDLVELLHLAALLGLDEKRLLQAVKAEL
jgi:transcriptional regulator with XRE-family HTH domain